MSCPHETCPTAFTDIIKKSEDKSEQRAVCEAEREREREGRRISSFTRNNEQMSHDHTTSILPL